MPIDDSIVIILLLLQVLRPQCDQRIGFQNRDCDQGCQVQPGPAHPIGAADQQQPIEVMQAIMPTQESSISSCIIDVVVVVIFDLSHITTICAVNSLPIVDGVHTATAASGSTAANLKRQQQSTTTTAAAAEWQRRCHRIRTLHHVPRAQVQCDKDHAVPHRPAQRLDPRHARQATYFHPRIAANE